MSSAQWVAAAGGRGGDEPFMANRVLAGITG